MQNAQIQWKKFEPWLFFTVLVFNLLPVLGVPIFFTGDGPAHLYNSNIIGSLLSKTNSAYLPFFELREVLIPNLGGHTMLTIFNALLPAIWAEKLLSALYLVALPLSFRFAIKSWSDRVHPFVFFIFPLAHNFCFYIGFQSFVLGLAWLFFSLGYAKKVLDKNRWQPFFGLSALLFGTAYFHIFAAAVAFLAIGFVFAMQWFRKESSWKLSLKFMLAAMPALLFCAHFVFAHSQGIQPNKTPFANQLETIYKALPLVTIDGREWVYSVPFFLLLVSAIFAIVFSANRKKHISFLWTGAMLLALYFLLPNQMASGGFVSFRLLLCAFLLFAFWVATSARFNKFSTAIAALVLLLNIVKVPYQWNKSRELSADAAALLSAEKYLTAGSKVVVLNYSLHWLHYNIGLYLGAENDIVVLDNYEAEKVHFPVKWKAGMAPEGRLGDFAFSNSPELKIAPYENETNQRVDAVLRWKHNPSMHDEATQKTDSILSQYFTIGFISPDGSIELYTRKED